MFSLTRRRRDSAKNPDTGPSRKNFQTFDPDGKTAWELERVAIDTDGTILYASPSFIALAQIDGTQLDPRDAKGVDAFSVIRFADLREQNLAHIEAGLHRILLGRKSHAATFYFDWIKGRDGKRYLIGSSADGKNGLSDLPPPHILEDLEQKITRARRAEPPNDSDPALQAARLRPEDIEKFAGITQDIMLVADDFGSILRVNEAFFSRLGYDPHDVLSMDFLDLFEDAERPYIRNTLQTLNFEEESRGSHSIEFEAKIKTKSGAPRWMSWRQFFNGSNMYCMGRDITDLQTQKDSLARHEQQLTQAESIGRMGHWRWVIGENNILWSNEIFRIFGVSKEDFKPTLESMNALVHRRDQGRVNQAFQRAIIEQNDYDMEFRVQRPDGQIRYIRCEGRCELDAQDDAIALYGIMQDMTERTLYERDLKDAKEAAERAYNAKSQFLANMSHELRTPLNAIIGFSEMIERQLLGPIGTEKYLEYISGIRQSGEHLLDIISDILDMSKIEAGKYELALEEINLLKVVKTGLHMMENRAMDEGVKLSYDGSVEEELKMVADRRAVLQIMLNLLSNAIKFTNEGGKVCVECHAREDYALLKVIDNGIGIPANKLSSVTNPFEQVSSHYTREHEGSGLGLAITKDLVELHGGTLFIESAVGQGTTVTIRLPFQPRT